MTGKLPHLIRHSPKSDELVCLHEAGHVLEILKNGAVPEFVEIYSDPEPSAKTRTPAFSGRARENVAASGYAVEVWLYRKSRLVDAHGEPVTEKAFMQEAIGENASADKIKYFGENREQENGCWPADDDLEFMKRGLKLSEQLNVPFIEEFATTLVEVRRLEKMDIEAIAKRHGLA
ncbi:MAG: hypothetical protein ACLPWS_17830 [Rhodomicrobium sp.]